MVRVMASQMHVFLREQGVKTIRAEAGFRSPVSRAMPFFHLLNWSHWITFLGIGEKSITIV